MKTAHLLIIIWCLSAIFLSGCSAIKKALPDKKDNYKSATELPPLEIPPDLSGSVINDPSFQIPNDSSSYNDIPKNGSVSSKPKISSNSRPAMVSSDDSGSFLEIYEAFPQAWRKVGKALSNLEIEIADKNRSIGMYYILYEDPDTNQPDERSVWDYLAFWRDVEVKEKELQYRVKLEESEQSTKVFLLNRAGKKQSDGVGLRLLKMMEEKLTQKKS